MTTEFKVGDVVRVTRPMPGDPYDTCGWGEEGTVYEIHSGPGGGSLCIDGHHGRTSRFAERCELVRRASESQREGGWILHGTAWAGPGCTYWDDGLHGIHNGPGGLCSCGLTLKQAKELGHIPTDPAPAQQDSSPAGTDCAAHVHAQHNTKDGCRNGVVPSRGDSGHLPQPAPMTRAARVKAGLEKDPYEGRCRSEDHDICKEMRRLDGIGEARLRMAKWSLDRPLDAEQARWERLVCSKVPVGRR